MTDETAVSQTADEGRRASAATRLLTLADVPELTDLICVNKSFLAPWEPSRTDDYFTVGRQKQIAQDLLDEHGRGTCLPHVIVDDDGRIVGRITLNGIVRGAFQSCAVGYWVGQTYNGLGLAEAALRNIVEIAFGELGLHRIQAETLQHNLRSQRLLERTGFVRYGLAPSYLKIAGEWQDFLMYQLLNPDDRPGD